VDLLRQRLDQRNFASRERLSTVADRESPSDLYARNRLSMLDAQRAQVLKIRATAQVDSEVVADVLALLDVEESLLDIATQERQELRVYSSARRTGFTCADLHHYPAIATGEDPVRQRCLDEEQTWVAPRQRLECGTSAAAATPPKAGTPPPTSTPSSTRRCKRRSRGRTDAGATSITPPPDAAHA
jgi:CPA1 family monovalent cation:H+ antiporter